MSEFEIERLGFITIIGEPGKHVYEWYLNEYQNIPLDEFVDKDASQNTSSVIACQVPNARVHDEIHFIPKF
jgi:hypothetical protein